MAPVSVLAENGKVRVEMDTAPSHVTFRPIGTIDEDVNFALIHETLKKMAGVIKNVEFDLGHVNRINSCGVREWILLMERIPPTLQVSFVNVNELLIEQANMIPAMFGGGKSLVRSFHVPYHCGSCNLDVSMVAQPGQVEVRDREVIPPPFDCPKCGKKLEFDWVEDGYFNFLGLV